MKGLFVLDKPAQMGLHCTVIFFVELCTTNFLKFFHAIAEAVYSVSWQRVHSSCSNSFIWTLQSMEFLAYSCHAWDTCVSFL